MRSIYLDHAATTYTAKEVLDEMLPYFTEIYANPGSLHTAGLKAKEAVDTARNNIAKILNCSQSEITFTSGGTESINLALIAGANFAKKHFNRNHIITTQIEHPAVLETCKFLETHGFKVTYLKVDKFGLIDPLDLESALTKETALVSIMYANNEIGTVQLIKQLTQIVKNHDPRILFHTDACQAACSQTIDTKELKVDLMTLNGSKIYGPKGIAILFIKQGIKLQPIIHGGGQENNLRSGTLNVPSIIGFAKALEIVQKEKEQENKRLTELRDYLIENITKAIPKSFLNGHPTRRLPNNTNISILDVEGESMLLYLDQHGIYASTGSACSSKSLEPSHVLLAIGLKPEAAHGSLRFSLGKITTKQDIDELIKVLPDIVNKLRLISPVKLDENEVKQ